MFKILVFEDEIKLRISKYLTDLNYYIFCAFNGKAYDYNKDICDTNVIVYIKRFRHRLKYIISFKFKRLCDISFKGVTA